MEGNGYMEIERKIANEIMKTVHKLRLLLVLDELTEGKGDCFPLAILSQCQRQEILVELNNQIRRMVLEKCPTLMRKAVKDFIMMSNFPSITRFKERYKMVVAAIDNCSWENYWENYWEKMIRQYEWVDYTFVQSVAWYLGHDIIIVTTSGTMENPYMRISGNVQNEEIHCSGTPLIIGCKSSTHYQSLLPVNGWMTNRETTQQIENHYLTEPLIGQGCLQIGKESKNMADCGRKVHTTRNSVQDSIENSNRHEFIYNSLKFKILTSQEILCPICQLVYKNIYCHVRKGNCKVDNFEEFIGKLKNFMNDKFDDVKKKQRERKARSRKHLKAIDSERLKNVQARYQAKLREKTRDNDLQKVRIEATNQKAISDARLKEIDHKKFRENQCKHKSKSDANLRERDIDNVKAKLS